MATSPIRQKLAAFGGSQVDEWPYVPRFSTTGGDRANLANFRVANGTIQSADEPLPRLNLSGRFCFNNDMSMTSGRHNIKMGVAVDYNRKTEPGSADYMGNFNFGHDANNPLSTGNGYANMLLGVFTTYTEQASRIDRDVGTGRMISTCRTTGACTPGLRSITVSAYSTAARDFEVNEMNSGFFTDHWNRNQAARVSTAGLHGRPRRATRRVLPTSSARSIPANPGVFLSTAFNGNMVQGTGNQINGITTGGIEGRKPGTYFTFPYFVYAPRVGFAWNMFGDGKTALRGSWGIFYNFPRSHRAAAATRSPADARSRANADPLGHLQ